MRRGIFSLLTICMILCSLSFSVTAHPGKTDANGGHYNRKTGEYHYHNGGGSSSGSSSSSSSRGTSSYSSVPKTIYATKVDVSNMPSSIDAGESVKLNGSAYPSNAEDQAISWESSDTAVATVDSNGNLTAVGVGNVVISAKTSRGTTSKFNLTVKEVIAESIKIEGKKEEIKIGDTALLSVAFLPEKTTYKDVEWKSDDEKIVSVDGKGKITALSVGKTTITALHKELSDSFEIEVKPILAEDIDIFCINKDTGEEYEELRFKEGTVLELSAVVSPDNTTDETVKWSVDNPDVAKVDENGTITALKEGTIIVTAETSNGIKDTIEIEIYKTSMIVNIIAGIIVFIICAAIIGGPVFLIIWLKTARKKLCK